MKPIEKAFSFIDIDKPMSKLSELFGVPAGSISDFKNGRRDLNTARYETIQKLSEAYDTLNGEDLEAYRKEAIDFVYKEVTVSELRQSTDAIIKASTTGSEIANALEMLNYYMMDSYKPDETFTRLKELANKGKSWK